MNGAPVSTSILSKRDPAILQFNPEGIQGLTIDVGNLTANARKICLDAGTILAKGFSATPPEQLTRRGRMKRWAQLHAVRSLIHRAANDLRHAAARLDAEYQLLEEQLCALEKQKRPSRVRRATPPKA